MSPEPPVSEQIVRAYQSGIPLDRIARAHDVSYRHARTTVLEAGVELRPPSVTPWQPSPAVTNAIANEYNGGATLRQLAAKHEVTNSVMRRALIRAGVTLRARGRRPGA
jgi:hypothetical protein